MIRAVEPRDRAPIERMVTECGAFTREEIAVAMELVDDALANDANADYHIFVYDENGEAAGYVCLGPTPLTEGTFDLYWIAVAPQSQHAGIGRQLTQRAETYVRERGGRLLLVETSSKPNYTRTRKFYERAGYVQLAEISHYYRLDDNLVIYGKYFR